LFIKKLAFDGFYPLLVVLQNRFLLFKKKIEPFVFIGMSEHMQELWEEMIHEASSALYNKELDEKCIPFSVNKALEYVTGVVQLTFLSPDHSSEVAGVFAPDEVPVDSWARGMIPLRKRQQDTCIEILPDSVKSSSKASKSVKSVGSRFRGKKVEDKRKKRGELAEYLIVLPDDDVVTRKPSSQERCGALRFLEDKEKAEAELQLERKRKEEEENSLAETLSRELNGKEFLLDHQGKLIIVQSINPDALPNIHYEISQRILEDQEEPRAPSARKQNQEEKSSHQKYRDSNNEHYRCAVSFQQSLLKNPHLLMQPGVSMKEGNNSSFGPLPQLLPNQMSREHFSTVHQISLQESIHGIGVQSESVVVATQPEPVVVSPAEYVDEIVAMNVEITSSITWGQNLPDKICIPTVLPKKELKKKELKKKDVNKNYKMESMRIPDAVEEDQEKSDKISVACDNAQRLLGIVPLLVDY